MTDISMSLVPSKDIQDRCCQWVVYQGEQLQADVESFKRKMQLEADDYYNTDSEFTSISECGAKKRRLGVQLRDEVLHLKCEWKDCAFTTAYMESFVKHVSDHIPDLKTKIKENNEEVYVCKWNACLYESGLSDNITRHVNYHSYHTKLKCIGSNVRGRIKLPRCYRDLDWKNIVDLTSPHICRWEECLKVSNNYQMYLYHVTAHVDVAPRGNKVNGGLECKWTGCQSKYPSVYKLREHVRCHTKEKIVACPDCGATFASNTKFHVHCKRQIPIDVQGFQCFHCYKYYATESILRDHMRFHIFHYKCTLCDMSCESPASLAKHIRYRHISSRTFPCQLCSHSAKSQQDLDSHMTVHTNGPNFSCHFDGCPYTCKGAYTLDRHIERVHSLEVRWYCCHECPIKYRKSQRLTKHLIETHRLQLPSGHKRFQYMHDEDGCYRLQIVRYESVDEENPPLVQETMLPDKKYKIKLNHSVPLTEIEILEDMEQTEHEQECQTKVEPCKSMPVISNILISIDEVDAEGNIIQSKIVETCETNELPPSDESPVILT